jgi:hypothetical protein
MIDIGSQNGGGDLRPYRAGGGGRGLASSPILVSARSNVVTRHYGVVPRASDSGSACRRASRRPSVPSQSDRTHSTSPAVEILGPPGQKVGALPHDFLTALFLLCFGHSLVDYPPQGQFLVDGKTVTRLRQALFAVLFIEPLRRSAPALCSSLLAVLISPWRSSSCMARRTG